MRLPRMPQASKIITIIIILHLREVILRLLPEGLANEVVVEAGRGEI